MISFESYRMLTSVYPVFDSLPVSWQQSLCSDGFSVKADRGQQAFDCGDTCNAYLMLVSGSLRVSTSMPQGRELVLYYVRPGDSCLLTVSGILGEQPYTACGTWEQDSEAFGINAALFRQLIFANEVRPA